jgi:hypothetical protein
MGIWLVGGVRGNGRLKFGEEGGVGLGGRSTDFMRGVAGAYPWNPTIPRTWSEGMLA